MVGDNVSVEQIRYPASFGAYQLLSQLGQGSAGSAHLARSKRRGRDGPALVVIKLLHGRFERHDEFVKRFRHEAQIAVDINSPYVVRVFDVGRVKDRLYIALEYVPGWTLGELIGAAQKQQKPPPVNVALEVGRQIFSGLNDLHNAKNRSGQCLDIVHRDISPKNIMVGDDGGVRIIDLGLGKSKAQDWKTQAGRIMGSPGYMAPEQIGGEFVDRRGDVFAAGTLLYELLTIQRYIPLGEPIEMMRMTLEKAYVPLRHYRSDIPAGLDELIQSTMRLDLSRRLPSAKAFLTQAESLLRRQPVGRSQVGGWIQSLLQEEQRARRSELKRALAFPWPAEELEPEVQDTEVWARRDDSRTEVQVTLPPTRVTDRPARRYFWHTEFFRLGVAIVLGGLVGGILVKASEPQRPLPLQTRDVTEEARDTSVTLKAPKIIPLRVEAPSLQPSEDVAEQPKIIQTPSVSEKEVQPSPRSSSVDRRRSSRHRLVDSEALAAQLAKRLIRRANIVRQKNNPPMSSEAAKLLLRIQMAQRVPEVAKRLKQLEALSEELKALEAGGLSGN